MNFFLEIFYYIKWLNNKIWLQILAKLLEFLQDNVNITVYMQSSVVKVKGGQNN